LWILQHLDHIFVILNVKLAKRILEYADTTTRRLKIKTISVTSGYGDCFYDLEFRAAELGIPKRPSVQTSAILPISMTGILVEASRAALNSHSQSLCDLTAG
jgi:hypothetical protein